MPKTTISRSKNRILGPRTSKTAKTIGILHSGTDSKRQQKEIAALINSLDQAGYSVGRKTLTIVPNGAPLWCHDDPKELQDNAHALAVNKGIDLIIAAGGSASTYEVASATAGTGINGVFTTFSKRISPAANMTGVCARTSELDVDRLTNLYQLVQPPPQTKFGVLENPTRKDYDPAPLQVEADRLQIEIERMPVYRLAGETDGDVVKLIQDAFAIWGKNKVKYALVAADPIFNDHRDVVIKAENNNKIGAMHQWHEFKDEGGYTSYGTSLVEAYQQAGKIAGRVLSGTDPSTIPVYVLANVALLINQATAKRLHLTSKV
jgi:putative ABC transport system substrate-binding protein